MGFREHKTNPTRKSSARPEETRCHTMCAFWVCTHKYVGGPLGPHSHIEQLAFNMATSLLRAGLRAVRPASATLLRAARPAAAAPVQERFLHQTPQNNFLEGKTGQTGAAVLTAGVAATLLSKEILILHNETIVVASVGLVTALLINKVGGSVGAALDDRAKNILDTLGASRTARIEALEAQIQEQEETLATISGIPEIFEINRHLADMSRELSYRTERKATRDAAVEQLEGMLKIETAELAQEQADLVNQLEAEVVASLKSQEDAILAKCITDLKTLSA
eukprot:m.17788 g.17788  ORF g.17788 m.17788 type:complete len:280 (+) comp5547_c0_seq1:1837-2676(+)